MIDGICQIHTSPEIWKDIPGFEGTHQASNRGRIKSLNRTINVWEPKRNKWKEYPIREKILKGSKYKDGYIHSELSRGVRLKVEHFVLMAFVGPCPAGQCSCHSPDNDKSHNCIENLRWGTYYDNNMDRDLLGLLPKGSKVNTAKLTEEYGVENPENLRQIWLRNTWKHV